MGWMIFIGIILLIVFGTVGGFLLFAHANQQGNSKKWLVCGILSFLIAIGSCIGFIAYGVNNTEAGVRWKKNLDSDFNGGLERRITHYNQNKEVLGQWEGRIDLESSSESSKIEFVLNGKKILIYKGNFDTIIVEEL